MEQYGYVWNNATGNWTLQDELFLYRRLANTLYYLALCPVAFFGNVLTVVVVGFIVRHQRTRRKSIPDVCLGSLACVDLFSVVFIHSVSVAALTRGSTSLPEAMCTYQAFMCSVYMKMQFLLTVLISIDRHLALVRPLLYHRLSSLHKVKIILIVFLLVSVASAIMTLMLNSSVPHSKVKVLDTWPLCLFTWDFYTLGDYIMIGVTGFVFLSGSVAFIVCNVTLVRILWHYHTKRAQLVFQGINEAVEAMNRGPAQQHHWSRSPLNVVPILTVKKVCSVHNSPPLIAQEQKQQPQQDQESRSMHDSASMGPIIRHVHPLANQCTHQNRTPPTQQPQPQLFGQVAPTPEAPPAMTSSPVSHVGNNHSGSHKLPGSVASSECSLPHNQCQRVHGKTSHGVGGDDDDRNNDNDDDDSQNVNGQVNENLNGGSRPHQTLPPSHNKQEGSRCECKQIENRDQILTLIPSNGEFESTQNYKSTPSYSGESVQCDSESNQFHPSAHPVNTNPQISKNQSYATAIDGGEHQSACCCEEKNTVMILSSTLPTENDTDQSNDRCMCDSTSSSNQQPNTQISFLNNKSTLREEMKQNDTTSLPEIVIDLASTVAEPSISSVESVPRCSMKKSVSFADDASLNQCHSSSNEDVDDVETSLLNNHSQSGSRHAIKLVRKHKPPKIVIEGTRELLDSSIPTTASPKTPAFSSNGHQFQYFQEQVRKVLVKLKRKADKQKKELLLARLVVVCASLFVLTWAPYVTLILLSLADIHASPILQDLALKLIFLNAVVNPLFYGLCRRNYRKGYDYITQSFCHYLSLGCIDMPGEEKVFYDSRRKKQRRQQLAMEAIPNIEARNRRRSAPALQILQQTLALRTPSPAVMEGAPSPPKSLSPTSPPTDFIPSKKLQDLFQRYMEESSDTSSASTSSIDYDALLFEEDGELLENLKAVWSMYQSVHEGLNEDMDDSDDIDLDIDYDRLVDGIEPIIPTEGLNVARSTLCLSQRREIDHNNFLFAQSSPNFKQTTMPKSA